MRDYFQSDKSKQTNKEKTKNSEKKGEKLSLNRSRHSFITLNYNAKEETEKCKTKNQKH